MMMIIIMKNIKKLNENRTYKTKLKSLVVISEATVGTWLSLTGAGSSKVVLIAGCTFFS